MLIDGNRPNGTRHYPWPIAPDTRREQLLNQFCELREDPHFAEWCRLTSALGLGALPLEQLAALHAGAAEMVFPEVGEWDRAGGGEAGASARITLVSFAAVDGAGAAGSVLDDGAMPGTGISGHADGLAAPELGTFVPPIEQHDYAVVAHAAYMRHNTERTG